MAQKVLLISENTLKTYALVNDNVDGKYILPAIGLVQDIDLDTIIGPVLNNKLQDLVSDGSIQTNVEYKKLLDDYITPYMVWQVMSAIQMNINFKLTNSGTIQNQDDKKTAIEHSNGIRLQAQYERYAQSYAIKLRDFLVRNTATYPEYMKQQDYEFSEDPQLCGIFLPTDRLPYKYIGK